MRTFSRWARPTRTPASAWVRWTVLGILIIAAVLLSVRYYPWVPLISVVVIALGYVAVRRRNARMSRVAAEREGESICTFVRAFARGDRDPRILRAVYEELIPLVTAGDATVPLRPTDHFEDDLELDIEDLEFLMKDIAARAGRSLDNTKANPYYERVHTVRNLVLFLRAQPHVAA